MKEFRKVGRRCERRGKDSLGWSAYIPRHALSPPALPSASHSLPSGPGGVIPVPPPNPYLLLTLLSALPEKHLPSPFLGLHACGSSCPCSSCCVGAIPQASVSLASGMVLQSVLSESPLFPFFRKGSGRFVPRLDKIQQEWVMQGQIRDTRLRDRKGKHGTILGDLDHLVTSF